MNILYIGVRCCSIRRPLTGLLYREKKLKIRH